jgi:hypothetical protein
LARLHASISSSLGLDFGESKLFADVDADDDADADADDDADVVTIDVLAGSSV